MKLTKSTILIILTIFILTGSFLYLNKTKKTEIENGQSYQKTVSQVKKTSPDEKLFVEKYIRDNIKTIAKNNPVLGGSWYVVSVFVDPSSHTAEVVYEDGHIQSKANIIYGYQKFTNNIEIKKFKIIE